MNKLLEFQKRVEAIKKDAQNPFFKSNYFDINSLLGEIKPLLNDLGLILNQAFKMDSGKTVLTTSITDSDTNEVLITSAILLPEQQDPQKLGSAITYLRRYSLQSLLALQAEDDDGNKASHKEIDKKPVNFIRFLKTKLSGASNLTEALELLEKKTGVNIPDSGAAKLEDLIDNNTAKELLDSWKD